MGRENKYIIPQQNPHGQIRGGEAPTGRYGITSAKAVAAPTIHFFSFRNKNPHGQIRGGEAPTGRYGIISAKTDTAPTVHFFGFRNKNPLGQIRVFIVWIYFILYLSLRLSAIMAMNSELVGLPRLFCIV